MKQIVPFIKEIKIDNNIEEITSISLDQKTNDIKDNEIIGEFDLYFEYKENDISINVLKHKEIIPFNVNLDDRYFINNAKIDIDDFYYEIDDSKVILHIDLLVNNIEIKEKEMENIIPMHETTKEERDEINDIEIDDLFKEMDTNMPLEVEIKNKNIKPIFETFDSKNETYVTYNVHIVRDVDNINSICDMYKVTKEELSYYNDIKEIKLGDKLIVPTYKK